MRIVPRQEFLAMPAGTVFMKFPAQPKDGGHIDLGYDGVISIKEDTVGEDFVVQDLFPWFEGVNDSGEWSDAMIAMLKGEPSPPLDYECAGRDGLFDREQLFLVWGRDDLERMIGCLQGALASGYKSS
jgi:hypothetical protein